jgi:hypothetical protein
MNVELEQHCHIEIKDLESKGFIQKSRSPWSCTTFNVDKNSEIKKGTPRLFINYKLLNKALKWIRYPIPNKKRFVTKITFCIYIFKVSYDVRILANSNSSKRSLLNYIYSFIWSIQVECHAIWIKNFY